MSSAPAGVLLLTFGSAVTSAEVLPYLRSVRGGREPSEAVAAEFRRRFDVIGRSPLLDITAAQGEALQALLDARHGAGTHRVAVGMLHSEPTVDAGLGSLLRAGADRVAAIVLAPQFSPLILAGYRRALDAAVAAHAATLPVTLAGPWHLTEGWVESLAERTREALAQLGGGNAAVVFTSHSLPRAVVERDPGYLAQIQDTVRAVASRVGCADGEWQFAYQSAGHTPEEWLKPDLLDVLPGIAAAGHRGVLVVPVQFVADHLETLYDIDVAAAQQARAAGLAFHRIAMPNTAPRFIEALADVAAGELSALPA
ncbi:MAG: ferrochelatase [Candidatus Dormibacteria bacterium]